jgi:hypothetical protein
VKEEKYMDEKEFLRRMKLAFPEAEPKLVGYDNGTMIYDFECNDYKEESGKNYAIRIVATDHDDLDDTCECGRDNTTYECEECGQLICQDCEDIHVCEED